MWVSWALIGYPQLIARGPEMAWRPFKRASGGEGSRYINSLDNEEDRGHKLCDRYRNKFIFGLTCLTCNYYTQLYFVFFDMALRPVVSPERNGIAVSPNPTSQCTYVNVIDLYSVDPA